MVLPLDLLDLVIASLVVNVLFTMEDSQSSLVSTPNSLLSLAPPSLLNEGPEELTGRESGGYVSNMHQIREEGSLYLKFGSMGMIISI